MTYSSDLRWRAVVLYFFQGMPISDVSVLLGISKTAIKDWTKMFKDTGCIDAQVGRISPPRYPDEVLLFIRDYISSHPCFIFDELQECLIPMFPTQTNFSVPTLCRCLKNDLLITRKLITKKARESQPLEREEFLLRIQPFLLYPEQLIFLDETSKDGRSAFRLHAWSQRGTPAIVSLPFSRGTRISALAAFSYSGFSSWSYTKGTFTRFSFYEAFINHILPTINPYPMPNSIVVIDNAKIHMFKEFQDAIFSKGALLFFLPPYSPQLNPIEFAFALVKKFIQKNCNLAFSHCPAECIFLALKNVASGGTIAVNMFEHCGYGRDGFLNLNQN